MGILSGTRMRKIQTYGILAVFVTVLLTTSLLVLPSPAMAAYNWTSTGEFPGGYAGNNIYGSTDLAFDSAHGILYANSLHNGKIFRNAGPGGSGSWVYIGSGGGGETLAYDGVHNTLYADASGTNGVIKNSDASGGITWTSAGSPGPGTDVRDLLYYSWGTSEILFALSDDGNVYKNTSPSSGTTWQSTGGPAQATVNRVGMAYDEANDILYSTGGGKAYRLKNARSGGTTWQSAGIYGTDTSDLAYDNVHDNLYAADWITNSVYRNASPQTGGTWESISTGFVPWGLEYDSVNDILYSGNTTNVSKNVNPDTGSTWIDLGNPDPSATQLYANSLVCDPAANVLYAGTNVTLGSTQGGRVYRTPIPAGTSRYLAEGTTAWGFDTYISIMNTYHLPLSVEVTYMPKGRSNVTETVALPAYSQTTITNDHLVSVMGGIYDFSTKVKQLSSASNEWQPIEVDRTMSWTGAGAVSPEGHNSVGVNGPATTWYLPEGSTEWGFECWLCIQNPGATTAHCNVTYMREGESPVTVPHNVNAYSRDTVEMFKDLGNKDASIQVTSDVPVIPERSMYRHNRREGHDSIGTIAPASDFYLAEGTSAWGFTSYVCVQNPNNAPADVTITYMTPGGPKPYPDNPIKMPANSRKTVRVNDLLPNTDFSTAVHGSAPIIAERAMYWDSGSGEACHDSIGMASPHNVFYLPDGQTSEGRDTYTCVQNPNDTPVAIAVAYLPPGGGSLEILNDTVPANTRNTYRMVDKIPAGRAAIVVTCTTAGKKIMVERAMYWNNRGAGTDTIGGYSD